MTGFTNTVEAAILNDATVGLARVTQSLHLFKFSGAASAAAGQELNDDGTTPTNVAVVSGGGYAAKAVAAGNWSTAVGGAPTSKQLPATGSGVTFRWDASGAAFGTITCWAICSTHASVAYDSANVILSGPITDSSGNPVAVTVADGESIEINETNPILARLGDPAPAGTYASRTVPT